MNEELKDGSAADSPPIDCSGIPECLHPVVKQYGREMFALVFNAGMAGQATQALATLAQKHASRGGLHAVGVISQAFNDVSNSYAAKMGWSAGELAQCDRDIALAWKGQILVPGSALVLNG